MNKKEQAMVEELKTRLALRWTEPTSPDVPPPTDGSLTKGWLTRGDIVDQAVSSAASHGFGDKTTSQRPRSLYSTRILALKSLRHSVEVHCAERLRRIDRMIEEEEG